jgi:hypothetical protein
MTTRPVDDPVAMREAAIRRVEEKRRQEWKRSPVGVMRRAMGSR